jgi:hypothetical protein
VNIIERGHAFVESLRELSNRTAWDWRACPKCGDSDTIRYGTYTSHPWFLDGRRVVVIQRHKCNRCSAFGKTSTYSEQSAYLVRGSWYGREVHRYSVDLWQHGRSSLRRTVEFVRSLLGRQERSLGWRPLDEEPGDKERCHLAGSTLHRWLDGAGREAERTVEGQLVGVRSSGQVGVDGLWAVLRGKAKKVVLVVVDSVTGLIQPPVVVDGEESEESWRRLFARASLAGLPIQGLRGVTSDGARGLLGMIARTLWWVNHQRCVFHIWRNLGGELARRAGEAAKGLVGEAAEAARRQVRQELVSLVRAVIDAKGEAEAELALGKLRAHQLGVGLAEMVDEHLDALQVHLNRYNRGLLRVAPEWVWRDFRLRVSRGRNHGSGARLERAALVWQVYHNFTPAQWRSERRRCYRRSGKSCLEMAGASPGRVSYLDALAV